MTPLEAAFAGIYAGNFSDGYYPVIESIGDHLEHLDLAHSQAWALVDHQFSHIFVQAADRDPA